MSDTNPLFGNSLCLFGSDTYYYSKTRREGYVLI